MVFRSIEASFRTFLNTFSPVEQLVGRARSAKGASVLEIHKPHLAFLKLIKDLAAQGVRLIINERNTDREVVRI
jgi:hypothetical protein